MFSRRSFKLIQVKQNNSTIDIRSLKFKEPLFIFLLFLTLALLPVFNGIGIDFVSPYANSNLGDYLFTAGFIKLFAKVLLIHIGFLLFNIFFVNAFVTRPFIYSFFFILLTLTHTYIYYPHLFQEFVFFKRFISLYLPLFSPLAKYVLVGCFFVTYFIISIKNSKSKLQLGFRGTVLLLICAINVLLNTPQSFENSRSEKNVKTNGRFSDQSTQNLRNILLLGIDGLRPGALASAVSKNPDRFKYTRKFLSQGKTITNVISPIGRTFPALVSILSGKLPSEHGFRGNLIKNSWKTDEILKDSPVEKMKTAGYNITVGIEPSDYAYLFKGKIVDKVISSDIGLNNYFLPYYLRDLLTFGWLNNRIGNYLIPEIISNGSYYESWWPQIFRNSVISEVSNLNSKSNPQFQFFHIARPHFPGSNQFPYLKKRPNFGISSSLYGYSNLKSYSFNRNTNVLEEVVFNRQVYNESMLELIDFYLEGIFEYIYENSILENTDVFVFGDHGEAFYGAQYLPIGKLPSHGNMLAFNDDSEVTEITYISQRKELKNVESKFAESDRPFNLSDLFMFYAPRELAKSQIVFREPQSENDRWVYRSYPGQTVLHGTIMSDVDTKSGLLPFLPSLSIDEAPKQRAIYEGNLRLSLLFAYDGYKLYLEDLKNKNSKNLIHVNPERTKKLFQKFMAVFSADIKNGHIPNFDRELDSQLNPVVIEEGVCSISKSFPQNRWWEKVAFIQTLLRRELAVQKLGVCFENLLTSNPPEDVRIISQLLFFEFFTSFGGPFGSTNQEQFRKFSFFKDLINDAVLGSTSLVARDWSFAKLLFLSRINERSLAVSLREKLLRKYGILFETGLNYHEARGRKLIHSSMPGALSSLISSYKVVSTNNLKSEFETLLEALNEVSNLSGKMDGNFGGSPTKATESWNNFENLIRKQEEYKLPGVTAAFLYHFLYGNFSNHQKLNAVAIFLQLRYISSEELISIEWFLKSLNLLPMKEDLLEYLGNEDLLNHAEKFTFYKYYLAKGLLKSGVALDKGAKVESGFGELLKINNFIKKIQNEKLKIL